MLSASRITLFRRPLVSTIPQRSLASLASLASKGQLNPTQFHRYLKSNKPNELKEFLADESEIIAAESFHLQQQHPHPHPQQVNSEFAKQIHDLLQPTYGSEKTA